MLSAQAKAKFFGCGFFIFIFFSPHSAEQTDLASFPSLENSFAGLEIPLQVISQSHFSAITVFVFKKSSISNPKGGSTVKKNKNENKKQTQR